MESMICTGTNSKTTVIEDGKQVFPCRCGVTHRGDYAFEGWAHHDCLHDEPLSRLGDDQAMCVLCGEVFDIVGPSA